MAVRPSSGRGRSNRKMSLPSAQEMIRGMATDLFGSEWESIPVASSKAEFNAVTDTMYDSSVMDQYDPQYYDNLAGYTRNELLNEGRDASRAFVNPLDMIAIPGNLEVPGYQGPQLDEDESPADLTLVPTSTTNPDRPRTVAAGYDAAEEKLTVMFRDGTLYNYYEVDENEWAAFKANKSKGAIIYQMLDFKPRGYADASNLSKNARAAFYRFGRGVQSYKGGKIKGQTKTTYKTVGQSKRGRKKY